jgi:hypothetical protein
MLTAVGVCFAGVGTLGALLGSWQLLGWMAAGGVPVVAEVWRHSGLTGDLFVAFFAWLPAVLALGVLYHLFVATLGVGLVWRRGWARRGGLGLAALWISAAVIVWLVVRTALEDLARGFPERAGFAHSAEVLAGEVSLLSIAIGVGLATLLLQPAVRAQFRSGS